MFNTTLLFVAPTGYICLFFFFYLVTLFQSLYGHQVITNLERRSEEYQENGLCWDLGSVKVLKNTIVSLIDFDNL